jgi:hypothetical protein
MDLTCIPRQNPDYRLELLDGELLLYHLTETKILYCNPTASLIWQVIDGQRSLADIIHLLSESYPESAQEIAADVPETVQQFVQQGCIEIV